MQREISYNWSPELVGLGTRRFIFRHAGRALIGLTIAMIIAIVALISGRREGILWAVAVVPYITLSTWFRYYGRAIKICNEMPDRTVSVRIEPENITFQTSEQTTIMKWSRIKKLWVYPEVLLLFTYNQETFSLLPTGPLGEDGRRFIEDKVREHGGQVS